MLTHSDLVDAIQRIKPVGPYLKISPGDYVTWKHVDDLLAILRIHQAASVGKLMPVIQCQHCREYWPCETVQIVADRLTSWGVFGD